MTVSQVSLVFDDLESFLQYQPGYVILFFSKDLNDGEPISFWGFQRKSEHNLLTNPPQLKAGDWIHVSCSLVPGRWFQVPKLILLLCVTTFWFIDLEGWHVWMYSPEIISLDPILFWCESKRCIVPGRLRLKITLFFKHDLIHTDKTLSCCIKVILICCVESCALKTYLCQKMRKLSKHTSAKSIQVSKHSS